MSEPTAICPHCWVVYSESLKDQRPTLPRSWKDFGDKVEVCTRCHEMRPLGQEGDLLLSAEQCAHREAQNIFAPHLPMWVDLDSL